MPHYSQEYLTTCGLNRNGATRTCRYTDIMIHAYQIADQEVRTLLHLGLGSPSSYRATRMQTYLHCGQYYRHATQAKTAEADKLEHLQGQEGCVARHGRGPRQRRSNREGRPEIQSRGWRLYAVPLR